MFRNYFAAALRNLLRNRAISVINITGLAVGLAAALLVALYVRYEYSYEKFIPGHEDVYRFSLNVNWGGKSTERREESTQRIAGWLKLDFPEIEHVARFNETWRTVATGDRAFKEQVFEGDPDLFRVLPIPAVAGDLQAALDRPDRIAISRAIARKYFGRENVLGATLELDHGRPFVVSAVFDDLPGNTHLNFKLVVSALGNSGISSEDAMPADNFGSMGLHTYFRLRPGARIGDLRSRLPEFMKKNFEKFPGAFEPEVIAVADIHLSPDVKRPLRPRGNPLALRALLLVGSLIVLIAVFNFVNLTTARAANRGVEVGVRKLAGARRRDLALQFMGESMLYVTVAMLVALSLVELVLPAFSGLLDPGENVSAPPSIRFDYWRSPSLLLGIVGGTLLIGTLAGIYPAMVLSSFRPAAVIKGNALPGLGGARVRELLVILQLAILVGLVFAATVIYRQSLFALNSALRIDTDQVVIFNLDSESMSGGSPGQAFRNAAQTIPGVIGTTGSMNLPTNTMSPMTAFNDKQGDMALLQVAAVDLNFFEFYGVRILAGRTFSPVLATDRFVFAEATRPLSVIVNEAAVKRLGFSNNAEAVGKILHLRSGVWPYQNAPAPETLTIVGVVSDFPINSVRNEIEPSIYFVFEPVLGMLSIRVAGTNIPETLAALRAAWKKVGQNHPEEGWFLESHYRQLYADVILQQKTLSLFAGCAVFLAALGLFGLSIYTAQRRTREIGIRKVMGASTSDIMKMLLWAFSRPVFWASLIAWPVAAWAMHGWLEGFAYRVPLGWWWLPAASLASLAISLLTVSVHSYAVARQQPAGSLRYE
jgi:putative ABC transport system permease protein